MSSKAAESYDHEKDRVPCKICAGEFVPGGFKMPIPDGYCIWCFTRGRIYTRYTMMWDGLSYMAQSHAQDTAAPCDCRGCKIYRSALPIMEPSATMQTPQTNCPEGLGGNES